MSAVRVLPPQVADKIAAGEVIERPSSVVKELVENSLDAGATEVAVSLLEGGKGLIEVLDNGSGMNPSDLNLCVLRHATSKIERLEDLEKLQTLGFRGEALPSIAAVSEFSIVSRTKDSSQSSTAYELKTRSVSPITFGHFLSSPHGTCIRAQGLFSQIPARLKFLRSQGAEVSNVREWIERLALSHPQVGFRLTSDDRELLNLRPESEESRVQYLLGDGGDYPLQTANGVGGPFGSGALKIRVHWLQGLSLPQTRRLIQVVNKRAVRDRVLQQAILKSFKQVLMPGQFPALALIIDIDPSQIDVNVHPSKTEVRFLDQRKVFQAVEDLVTTLITEKGAPAFVPSERNLSRGDLALFGHSPSIRDCASSDDSRESHSGFFQGQNPHFSTNHHSISSREPHSETWMDRPDSTLIDSNLLFHPDQFSGILFNTYLLYSFGNELGLIDQHAAHERIRYEKLKKRALNPTSAAPPQALLMPEVIKFLPEDRESLASHLEPLKTLGFETEFFGEDSIVFRSLPSEWGMKTLPVRLKNLVEKLSEITLEKNALKGELLLDEALFESLASEACHSSVRAGDSLHREEALALTKSLFQCEHPWNCPHGRPTVVRVPRARLEEWFRRKI